MVPSGHEPITGFVLGVTSGAFCLTACAPILVPFLLGGGGTMRSDAGALAAFLSGRLIGYLAFGAIAWSVGSLLQTTPARFASLTAGTYIVLGVMMVLWGLVKPWSLCAGSMIGRALRLRSLARPGLLAALLGLFTGLNLCPPFLVAFAGAARAGTIAGSLLFFLAFFIGTSLFFVPFPALGALRRYPAARTVGRLAAVVVGLIYCGIGLGMLA